MKNVRFRIDDHTEFVGHETIERLTVSTVEGVDWIVSLTGRLVSNMPGVQYHVTDYRPCKCEMFDGALRVLNSNGLVKNQGPYTLDPRACRYESFDVEPSVVMTPAYEPRNQLSVDAIVTVVGTCDLDELRKIKEAVDVAIYDRERCR